MIEAMRRYPLDFIQVDYSIVNREAAASVLPVALERGAAVLANLPLARAALIGQAARRPLPDWAAARGRWPDAEMRAKMERFWDGLSTFTGGSV